MSIENFHRGPRPKEITITQKNGCRYLVPKREIGLENFIPPNGSEVYVFKLPQNCYEMELFQFVSTVGPVFDLRLMVLMDGRTRGFAFVRYFNPETAEKAIKELPRKALRGDSCFVKVQKSTDHRKLLLIGMSHGNACEHIRRFFDNEFPEELLDVREIENRVCPLYVLEFYSHKAAAIRKRETTLPRQWGSKAKLIWQPNHEVNERILKKKDREQMRLTLQQAVAVFLEAEAQYVAHGPDVQQRTYPRVSCSQTLPGLVGPPTPQQSVCDNAASLLYQETYNQPPSTALTAAYNQQLSLPSTSFSQLSISGMKREKENVAPNLTASRAFFPSFAELEPSTAVQHDYFAQAASIPGMAKETFAPNLPASRAYFDSFAGPEPSTANGQDYYAQSGFFSGISRPQEEENVASNLSASRAYFPSFADPEPFSAVGYDYYLQPGFIPGIGKENVARNKRDFQACFPEPEPSTAVGHNYYGLDGLNPAKFMGKYFAPEDDGSFFSVPDKEQAEPKLIFTKDVVQRPIIGRGNTESPSSPKKLRF